jgi:carbonic anhydrase
MRAFQFITTIIIFTYISSNTINYNDQKTWPSQCINQAKGSPVNIITNKATQISSDDLIIDYIHYVDKLVKPSRVIIDQSIFKLGYSTVVDNYILLKFGIETYKYTFTSLRFHCQAEHTFDNIRHPCELQIVHERKVSETDIDKNQYLIISVLFSEKTGASNPLLRMDNDIDLSTLLSVNREYFYYQGSITTPLCIENVNWLVMKDIQFASPLEISSVKQWITEIYTINIGNGRDAQELNGRLIQTISYDLAAAQEKYNDSIILNAKYSFLALIFMMLLL